MEFTTEREEPPKTPKTPKRQELMAMPELLHEDLTATIRQTAFDVHKYFRNGFLEKVYENSLAHRPAQDRDQTSGPFGVLGVFGGSFFSPALNRTVSTHGFGRRPEDYLPPFSKGGRGGFGVRVCRHRFRAKRTEYL